MNNNCGRSLLLAIEFLVIFFLPVMAAFALACNRGWLATNADPVWCVRVLLRRFCCADALTVDSHMSANPAFIIVKGFFAGSIAVCSYPVTLLGVLNRNHLPEATIEAFETSVSLVGAAGGEPTQPDDAGAGDFQPSDARDSASVNGAV